MGVSNITLVKLGAVCGLATVSMGLLLRSKINDNIKQTDYYKDALKTVRAHKGAVHSLGEPIKDRRINIDAMANFTKADTAHYEVPVTGPKQKGTIYFWAYKQKDSSWIVNRVELGLENEHDRRLLIKNITTTE